MLSPAQPPLAADVHSKPAHERIASPVVVSASNVNLRLLVLQLVQSQKGGYTAWADKGFEYQILQV